MFLPRCVNYVMIGFLKRNDMKLKMGDYPMSDNLHRREFLRSLGLAAAALALPGCGNSLQQTSSGKSTDKPNVVIIFCDDVGYADIGVFGAKGYETPNLDRMAAEGVKFTDFYAAASSCTPSRAALIRSTECDSNATRSSSLAVVMCRYAYR